MLKKVKDSKGFTLIEVMMVMIMLGILTQSAWNFMIDMRKRSSDIAAVADGRNLMTAIRASFINLDNIKFTHSPGQGRKIGKKNRNNESRPPIFTLSRGVMARIEAGSQSGIVHQGYYEAYLYHINGTEDASTESGKREFWYLADEVSGIYSLPAY
jgi:prepilin-type N-terminal cleavage/methylation domain-containing protein